MEIERNMLLDAPIDRVWEIVGEEFADIGSWATAVPSSTVLEGDAVEGAPTAGRTCAVAVPGFDYLEETLTEFDATTKSFTFEINAGLPGFVTNGYSKWQLHEESSERTRVELRSVIETKGLLGAVMGPMLKLNLKRTLKGIEKDLRHIAETGEPSPAKQRQLAKL